MPRTGNDKLDIQELYESLMWILPAINPGIGQIEPPTRYKRTGLIAYADGTNWNPNSQGAGHYRYDGANWIKLISYPGYPSVQTDVTGSRSYGTVYQNTTGRPMFVSVSGSNSLANAILSGYTDGANPPTITAQTVTITNNGERGAVFFVVLPGNYYKADFNTGTKTIVSWMEWY